LDAYSATFTTAPAKVPEESGRTTSTSMSAPFEKWFGPEETWLTSGEKSIKIAIGLDPKGEDSWENSIVSEMKALFSKNGKFEETLGTGVVSQTVFSGIGSDPALIYNRMAEKGYINAQGTIQAKYKGLTDSFKQDIQTLSLSEEDTGKLSAALDKNIKNVLTYTGTVATLKFGVIDVEATIVKRDCQTGRQVFLDKLFDSDVKIVEFWGHSVMGNGYRFNDGKVDDILPQEMFDRANNLKDRDKVILLGSCCSSDLYAQEWTQAVGPYAYFITTTEPACYPRFQPVKQIGMLLSGYTWEEMNEKVSALGKSTTDYINSQNPNDHTGDDIVLFPNENYDYYLDADRDGIMNPQDTEYSPRQGFVQRDAYYYDYQIPADDYDLTAAKVDLYYAGVRTAYHYEIYTGDYRDHAFGVQSTETFHVDFTTDFKEMDPSQVMEITKLGERQWHVDFNLGYAGLPRTGLGGLFVYYVAQEPEIGCSKQEALQQMVHFLLLGDEPCDYLGKLLDIVGVGSSSYNLVMASMPYESGDFVQKPLTYEWSDRGIAYDGWSPAEIAEFIDGTQGARTTGKTALPTAEQQEAISFTAQNIVAPAYAELIGKEFDLDLSKVQIITGTPLEDFTACMYDGFLWINNAVFDESGMLSYVLYHEQVEKGELAGIVSPSDADVQAAHQKAQYEESRLVLVSEFGEEKVAANEKSYYDIFKKGIVDQISAAGTQESVKILQGLSGEKFYGQERLQEVFQKSPSSLGTLIKGITALGGMDKFEEAFDRLCQPDLFGSSDALRQHLRQDVSTFCTFGDFIGNLASIGGVDVFADIYNDLAASEYFGSERLNKALQSSPQGVSEALLQVSLLGGTQALARLLENDLIGKSALISLWDSKGVSYFSNTIKGIVDAGGMETFKQVFGRLCDPGLFGKEAMIKAVEYGGLGRICRGIKGLGGIEAFEALFNKLSEPGFFGKDALTAALNNDPSGFGSVIMEIAAVGGLEEFVKVYNTLSDESVLGDELFREMFTSRPSTFADFMNIMNKAGGADKLAELCGSAFFGGELIRKAFQGAGYQNFIRSVYSVGGIVELEKLFAPEMLGPEAMRGILEKGVGNFSSFMQGVKNCGGLETFKEWFSELCRPEIFDREAVMNSVNGLSGILSKIGEFGGIDNFRSAFEKLSQTELFGRDLLSTAFSGNPFGVINALLEVKNMRDADFDIFKADCAFLFGVFDKESVFKAFSANAQRFETGLQCLHYSKGGSNSFKIKAEKVIAICGEELVAGMLKGKFYETVVAILSHATFTQEQGVTAYANLCGFFGKEAVNSLALKDPVSFVISLEETAGISREDFYSAFNAAVALAGGQKRLKEYFCGNGKAVTGIISAIADMGAHDYVALSIWCGNKQLSNSFNANADDVCSFLKAVSIMGVDDFIQMGVRLSAEYGKDKVTGLIFGGEGIMRACRFISREAVLSDQAGLGEKLAARFESILGNRLSNTPDGSPLAVLIFSNARDWNNAFEYSNVFDSLNAYRIMYYEVENENELFASVSDATKDEKAFLDLFVGHGTRTAITLGDTDSQDVRQLDLSDRQQCQTISSSLQPGGVIVLYSCSTGEGRSEKANMANMLADCCSQAQGIFAPTRPAAFGYLIIQEDKVVDVVYYYPQTEPDKTYNAMVEYINKPMETVISYDGKLPGELAEFIDGTRGARTTGKAAAPSAEQREAIFVTAQNIVIPAYAELIGKEFDLDLSRVQIVTGTALEDFTACMYDGFLWINNAVFDDAALLADVLYHEEAETDILSGIVNPTEEQIQTAHLQAEEAADKFEDHMISQSASFNDWDDVKLGGFFKSLKAWEKTFATDAQKDEFKAIKAEIGVSGTFAVMMQVVKTENLAPEYKDFTAALYNGLLYIADTEMGNLKGIIKHEYTESQLMKQGKTRSEAHSIALAQDIETESERVSGLSAEAAAADLFGSSLSLTPSNTERQTKLLGIFDDQKVIGILGRLPSVSDDSKYTAAHYILGQMDDSDEGRERVNTWLSSIPAEVAANILKSSVELPIEQPGLILDKITDTQKAGEYLMGVYNTAPQVAAAMVKGLQGTEKLNAIMNSLESAQAVSLVNALDIESAIAVLSGMRQDKSLAVFSGFNAQKSAQVIASMSDKAENTATLKYWLENMDAAKVSGICLSVNTDSAIGILSLMGYAKAFEALSGFDIAKQEEIITALSKDSRGKNTLVAWLSAASAGKTAEMMVNFILEKKYNTAFNMMNRMTIGKNSEVLSEIVKIMQAEEAAKNGSPVSNMYLFFEKFNDEALKQIMPFMSSEGAAGVLGYVYQDVRMESLFKGLCVDGDGKVDYQKEADILRYMRAERAKLVFARMEGEEKKSVLPLIGDKAVQVKLINYLN
ncbi:MAG: hypothetical protein WBE75_07070, partial [Candidatus Omnitrophota bacterium]